MCYLGLGSWDGRAAWGTFLQTEVLPASGQQGGPNPGCLSCRVHVPMPPCVCPSMGTAKRDLPDGRPSLRLECPYVNTQ